MCTALGWLGWCACFGSRRSLSTVVICCNYIRHVYIYIYILLFAYLKRKHISCCKKQCNIGTALPQGVRANSKRYQYSLKHLLWKSRTSVKSRQFSGDLMGDILFLRMLFLFSFLFLLLLGSNPFTKIATRQSLQRSTTQEPYLRWLQTKTLCECVGLIPFGDARV